MDPATTYGMFTALILFCNVFNGECKGLANPEIYPTLEQCLASVAEGVVIIEQEPTLQMLKYECYEWVTEKDLKGLGY